MEKTKQGDFVEVIFTAKSNGEVFDSNIKEEVKKLNPKAEVKPLIVCIGKSMVIKGLDKALSDKELEKEYKAEFKCDEAYGPRNSRLVKLVSKKGFSDNKMVPQKGDVISLDNQIARIINVSGGRVLVDFNHPLAGKDMEYYFTIKRKVTDTKEKINALQDFFFGNRFEFELDEANKKIIFKKIELANILNFFREQFKDMVGYDLEILAKPEKKEDKKEEKKEDKKEQENPVEKK